MDIISAIDTAVGCQQCGKPLDRSVSDDFCGEGCQQAWHAKMVGARPDYWLDFGAFASPAVPGPLTVWIRPDTCALADGLRRMNEALEAMARGMSVSATRVAESLADLTEPSEKHAAQRSLMERALEARRTRSTGPASSGRAPRAINPRRTR